MSDRLFVYGTLRKDVRNTMFHLLESNADFVGHAWVQGSLFDLGSYPGLVVTSDGEGRVRGEVYELDAADTTLDRLDAYEGCGAADPEPHLFKRAKIEVCFDSGMRSHAWGYVYQGSLRGLREIRSGDYLDAIE